MKAISHKITHQYQPTPTTCSQTAFSMLLGHYNVSIAPLDIERRVPQIKDEQGNDSGTITQLLAAWATTKSFNVSLYTFDCQIIDQSWQDLKPNDVQVKLKTCLEEGWTVPALGEKWSRAYRQSYIDFINADSQLIIQPAVTSKLLYKLLEEGPLFTNICINTLYGRSKTRGEKLDDIHGRTWNHSIVIYGHDDHGNFFVADPIVKPGLHDVEPERMIAAITAAQIECDNLLFQLTPKAD